MTQALTIDQHRAELARIEEQRAALRRNSRPTRALDQGNRALDLAYATGYAGSGLTEALMEMAAALDATPEYGEMLREDDRLYEEAKVHVDALNEARRAKAQARINARQAAATHRAACSRCFTVHAGECL